MVRAQQFTIRLSSIIFGVGVGVFVSGIAAAHHSVSPYDRASAQELEGVITRINLRNPHIGLTLSVTDDSGTDHRVATRRGFRKRCGTQRLHARFGERRRSREGSRLAIDARTQ